MFVGESIEIAQRGVAFRHILFGMKIRYVAETHSHDHQLANRPSVEAEEVAP